MKVQFKFDDHAFEVLPRMFDSMSAVLAEVFQNCYRSGAGNVDVSYDPATRVLVIADDGPGVTSPGVLVTAGGTGWSEEIIEPAGIGAFALLAQQFVERVTYTSQHDGGAWKMVLTPEMLKSQEAEALEITQNGSPGLHIRIELQPDVRITREMIVEARAYYPYTVIWHQGDGSREALDPDDIWNDCIEVDTPAGIVTVGKKRLYRGRVAAIIWEHRPIMSNIFKNALHAAAEKHLYASLALHLLASNDLYLDVKPDSGIRPRLPDRSEFIDDINMHHAAGQVVEAVTTNVLKLAKEQVADWPGVLNECELHRMIDAATLPISHTMMTDLVKIVLPLLGWHRVSQKDLEHVVIQYLDQDGFEDFGESVRGWSKDAVLVSSEMLAHSLTNQGIWATRAAGTPPTKITIDGLRLSERSAPAKWQEQRDEPGNPISPHVALADRIHVEGVGEVKFLAQTGYEGWEHPLLKDSDVVLVYAGSAAEFVEDVIQYALPLSEAVAYAVFEIGELYDKDWFDYNGNHMDWEAVRQDLITQVTKAFDPAMATIRNQYYAMLSANRDITSIRIRLRRMIGELKSVGTISGMMWRYVLTGLKECVHVIEKIADLHTLKTKRTAKL